MSICDTPTRMETTGAYRVYGASSSSTHPLFQVRPTRTKAKRAIPLASATHTDFLLTARHNSKPRSTRERDSAAQFGLSRRDARTNNENQNSRDRSWNWEHDIWNLIKPSQTLSPKREGLEPYRVTGATLRVCCGRRCICFFGGYHEILASDLQG